jgi:hypothetical protein
MASSVLLFSKRQFSTKNFGARADDLMKGNIVPNVKVGTGILRAVEPTTSKHPKHKGSVTINGGKFWLSGWNRTCDDGKPWFSLAVDPADEAALADSSEGCQEIRGLCSDQTMNRRRSA